MREESKGKIEQPERRRMRRQRSLLGGQISFGKKTIRVDCVVRNLTARGAMLVLEWDETIPDEFELSIAGRNRSFRARLVWRRSRELGVRLLPMSVDMSPVRLARLAQRLQAENALLLQRIAELSTGAGQVA